MSEADLADYERAIVLSFELVQSPSKTQEQRVLQSEASLYCERVDNSTRGWTLTLQLLRASAKAEVKFFCLQSIQKLLSNNEKYSQLSGEDRVSLRSVFMDWVNEICDSLTQEARFVKSKLGVVIALLIKREFPAVWPTAFDELIQMLPKGPGAADVLVLTLSALDEEVVSIGGQDATLIKDAMRITAVAKIISTLGTIAVVYSETEVDLVRRCWWVCGMYVDWVDINLTTDEQFLSIWFAHCLDERYRTNAVAALGRLLQKGMDSASKLRLFQQLGLADACVEFCLRSAPRGSAQQITLDQQMQSAWSIIVSRLPSKAMGNGSNSSTLISGAVDEQFTVEAARFCQTLGIQMLECRRSFVGSGDVGSLDALRPFFDRALFCLFSFMGRVDKIDVQDAVLEFANRIVMCNKDTATAINGKKEIADRGNFFGPQDIHRMLFAVLASVRLPQEFNFNFLDVSSFSSMDTNSFVNGINSENGVEGGAADDDESEFREHRSNVKRLFLNLVRCSSPKAVLPFLLSVSEQSLGQYSPKDPPHNLEAVLYLVHAFGEGAPEVAQRQGAPEDVAGFDQVLLTIFRSPAFSQGANSPVIANMFNELAARYIVSVRAQSIDLIAHVVDLVAGTGGIHHSSSKVRTRAAGLFLRIVRSLEQSCAQLSERILLALQDVLALPYELCVAHFTQLRRRAVIKTDGGKRDPRPLLLEPDVVICYETVGIISGSSMYWTDAERRRMYLRAIVSPLQGNLERACAGIETVLPVKVDEVVHWGACQLEALASVAKGFPNQSDTPDILELWKEVLQTCLISTVKLQSFTGDVEFLLSNLRRFCHSMIRTIGTEILLFFPDICRALLEANNADICRALPLFNQMMSAFKMKMHQSLAASLLPILRATNARIAPVANRPQPTSHDREELIALEKELFTFLFAVASADLASVFCEGANRNYLEELLRMITDGMASVPDAAVQRICASTLLALIKEWLNSPPRNFPDDLRPAFLQFAFERITPASFQATAQPHFDASDAACSTLLVMICTIHRTLFELCGQEWLEYTRRVFLPSVNCPVNIADEYCQAVTISKTPKDLRGHFKKLFLDDKKTAPM